ncbi:MAG TPA: hypothetical protein VKR60_05960 [Candidatus Sulfotelmatobacter sp.]|nr:hypothetical protein [Candidatus Sulfotelmatobacter sp.]
MDVETLQTQISQSQTLQTPESQKTAAQEAVGAEAEIPRQEWIWSPDQFAREQLRGLVQRIFFSGSTRPVRQVVFSAAESRTDVAGICRQVGEILSRETPANIAVVAGDLSCLPATEGQFSETSKRDSLATRVRTNLWLSPGLRRGDVAAEMLSSTAWYSRLCELRREFEYSILEGPAAGKSSDAAIAAQVADGMILVLTAHGTRRAAVQCIQETLQSTQTHLLGTILAERRFPIPEGLYRRL